MQPMRACRRRFDEIRTLFRAKCAHHHRRWHATAAGEGVRTITAKSIFSDEVVVFVVRCGGSGHFCVRQEDIYYCSKKVFCYFLMHVRRRCLGGVQN